MRGMGKQTYKRLSKQVADSNTERLRRAADELRCALATAEAREATEGYPYAMGYLSESVRRALVVLESVTKGDT